MRNYQRIDSPEPLSKQRKATCDRRAALLALATAVAGSGLSAQEPVSQSGVSLRVATGRIQKFVASATIQLKPLNGQIDPVLVQAIAVDPRGQFLAVAGDDHAIRILSATTLNLVKTLTGHVDLIRTLDFDSQGKRLVSAGMDGQLILWNREQEFSISQRLTGTPALACVRFSPDGKEIAAVGFDEKVFLIGGRGDAGRPDFTCECTDLRGVAYRDDGKIMAVAGRSGELHLFDRTTNKLIGEHKVHQGRVHQLEFAPNSNVVLSASEDGTVCLFDTESKVAQQIRVTSGKLFAVSILDSKHIAVAGSDNAIRIVHLGLQQVVERLDGHTGSIASLASKNGLLFSGGYDATLRRWKLTGLTGEADRIAERDRLLDR